MSDLTVQQLHQEFEHPQSSKQQHTSPTTPVGWRLVAQRELTDLWVGGRAMILVILFSILLGIMSYLLATNSEMSLMPPREMLFLTIQVTIGVGLFIGLLIGADSFSGERERATLEALLLAPISRRHIAIGKFLASISPWPVALAVASAHLAILAPNRTLFWQTFALGVFLGTLLVIGYTGFGMLVSIWSNSNRTSLFVSLVVYLLFVIPTQFPGTAQTGFMGRLVKRINPIESVNQFLEKVLVNNRTFDEMWDWLSAPIILAVAMLIILFGYAAPRLNLDGAPPSLQRLRKGNAAALISVLVILPMLVPTPALAMSTQTTPKTESPLQLTIDVAYIEAKTGDEFQFATTVTYLGAESESPAMIVAMNIVNLDAEGDPVDPEDWSPERSQVIESLAPGESAMQTWDIHPIFEGDYMVYMTLIPEPDGPRTTSQPVASPGIHLTVEQFTQLNPGGVLPIATGLPVSLLTIMGLMVGYRRRNIMPG